MLLLLLPTRSRITYIKMLTLIPLYSSIEINLVEVNYISKGKGKDKAIPLQAWTDPEGSRKLRFPDFKTVGT